MKKNDDLKKKLNIGFEQLAPKIDLDAVSLEAQRRLSEHEEEEIFGVKKKKGFGRFYRYSLVCSVMLLMIFSMVFVNNTNGYTRVLIQVNPAMELLVKNNCVEKIEAKNEDGKEIVQRIKVGETLDETVDDILQEIEKEHYFEKNHNVYITVSGNKKAAIEKQVKKQAQKTIDEMGVQVLVKVEEKPENESTSKDNEVTTEKKVEMNTGETKTKETVTGNSKEKKHKKVAEKSKKAEKETTASNSLETTTEKEVVKQDQTEKESSEVTSKKNKAMKKKTEKKKKAKKTKKKKKDTSPKGKTKKQENSQKSKETKESGKTNKTAANKSENQKRKE